MVNLRSGVASGATRAALTQHFSLENNAVDISAKEGSQETVATMVGMALGMVLAHVTRGNPLAVWMAFLSLTVFHMYEGLNRRDRQHKDELGSWFSNEGDEREVVVVEMHNMFVSVGCAEQFIIQAHWGRSKHGGCYQAFL
ncbi:hypothetical protein QJS10_CPA05g01853 [Acorus calamus]|uniref:Protein root UVB sensitive/RUS domain-containing protein n=1 Tax=Acorus calamus TaxID=4465 RepID=A0AAV9EX80_ACOCL|nr:hypothetical protein QJS10_CPA05g01853 [Acorus calamus]